MGEGECGVRTNKSLNPPEGGGQESAEEIKKLRKERELETAGFEGGLGEGCLRNELLPHWSS